MPCTPGTDDLALFDTDLTREHAPWRERSRAFFDAGVEGALCDEATRAGLRALGAATDWPARSPCRG